MKKSSSAWCVVFCCVVVVFCCCVVLFVSEKHTPSSVISHSAFSFTHIVNPNSGRIILSVCTLVSSESGVITMPTTRSRTYNVDEQEEPCDLSPTVYTSKVWTRAFHLFFFVSLFAMCMGLIGIIIFKTELLERAKKFEVKMSAPLGNSSCIAGLKKADRQSATQTLGLVVHIVKTKQMALTNTTLPSFDGLAILLAVALAINFVMLVNMEYPYSLCCRPKFCFGEPQGNSTRGFELPEPLFAFPTTSIVSNFLAKFVFLLVTFIVSITSEIEIRKPDCEDIMAVVSKKNLEQIYGDRVDSLGLAKRFCNTLHKECELSISIFFDLSTPATSLLLLMLSSIFVCLVCFIKWYVWIKFVADIVTFDEIRQDGDENTRSTSNLTRIRRSQRISRLLSGRSVSITTRSRRASNRTNAHIGYPRAGRFLDSISNNQSIPITPDRNSTNQSGNERQYVRAFDSSLKTPYHVTIQSNTDNPIRKESPRPSNTIDCVICLEQIDINDSSCEQKSQCLPCGHVFHDNCIEEWFKSKEENAFANEVVKLNCPVCRHTAR